jgi:cell division protein FtsN
MAKDYAKARKPSGQRPRKTSTRRKPAAKARTMGWQLYIAGLFSGVFLSFLLYLGTLPPTIDPATQATADSHAPAKSEPPKPRFDFYTLLPEQSVERPTAPIDTATPQSVKNTKNAEFYLLQTGSFKQREDADRRRAELILLGLEPNIEETNGDNGRWYRVYLGPFQSRAKLNKARSLTAAQNIDTLLLKRRSG